MGAERSSGLRWMTVRLEEWLRTASARMESALLVNYIKIIPARIVSAIKS